MCPGLFGLGLLSRTAPIFFVNARDLGRNRAVLGEFEDFVKNSMFINAHSGA